MSCGGASSCSDCSDCSVVMASSVEEVPFRVLGMTMWVEARPVGMLLVWVVDVERATLAAESGNERISSSPPSTPPSNCHPRLIPYRLFIIISTRGSAFLLTIDCFCNGFSTAFEMQEYLQSFSIMAVYPQSRLHPVPS